MRKKHYIIFVILLLASCLFFNENIFAQIQKAVAVKFEFADNKVNFSNDMKLVININGQEIEPLMYINGFIVPDLKGVGEVDVCFIYKGSRYIFEKLPVSKLETNWVFGIVKKNDSKRHKLEYFIKFNPKQGGDGTVVTVTKE